MTKTTKNPSGCGYRRLWTVRGRIGGLQSRVMGARVSEVAAVAVLLVCVSCATPVREDDAAGRAAGRSPEVVSLLGRPLYSPAPGEKPALEAQLDAARAEAAKRPDDPELQIWVARRLGYLWRFNEAIDEYSRALGRRGPAPGGRAHPDCAPLLRHRGHRYISIRRFDAAITDLERAAELTRDSPDAIEPDGQPNARNIPLTTLKFNIGYHLALARYLSGDFDAATEAWRQTSLFAQRYDHNRVATAYWRWLSLMRLNRRDEATAELRAISTDMDIIENHAYHRLLLLYKGERSEEQTMADVAETSADFAAIGYGVGMRRLLLGDAEGAKRWFERVVATEHWPAFGFIAAEVELKRMGPLGNPPTTQ